MKRSKVTPEMIVKIYNAKRENRSITVPPPLIDLVDKLYKDEGWKSRNQLIEHLLALWAASPGFAAIVNASRDTEIDWTKLVELLRNNIHKT